MYRIRGVRPLVVAVLAVLAGAVPSALLATGGVKLLVGSRGHARIGRLPPAVKDAANTSSARRRVACEVTTDRVADGVEPAAALRQIARRRGEADAPSVFEVNYGTASEGPDCLASMGARMGRRVAVRFPAVTVSNLLASTAGPLSPLQLILNTRRTDLQRASILQTPETRTGSGASFTDLREDPFIALHDSAGRRPPRHQRPPQSRRRYRIAAIDRARS